MASSSMEENFSGSKAIASCKIAEQFPIFGGHSCEDSAVSDPLV